MLNKKLPQFLAVVVGLAFLLLAVVFRSLLIPLVAAVMNLLSFGVALGVMTAAFQFGWGKSVLGFGPAAPIEAWIPALMFAVLFGLSTDYEVFLVSRMHEEWTLTGDNKRAVIRGQAETGRVITAASLIMILVFAAFMFTGQLATIEQSASVSPPPSSSTPTSSARSSSRPRCTCSGGPTGGCPRGWTGTCPVCTCSPPS